MSVSLNQYGILSVTVIAIFTVVVPLAAAQDKDGSGEPRNVATTVATSNRDTAKQTISFQLRDWKGMHFHDPTQAQKHLETVKQLGCVAKSGQHGGHIDVKYHCQEWKSISVDGADAVQKWENWLVSAGFDVFRHRPDALFAEGDHGVQFRLADWKSIQGNGTAEQVQLIDRLRKVGCDVRIIEQNGRTDFRYRAPIWCFIRVADEATANQWMEWFKAQHFEVQLAAKN